jgi:beta-phosphoglucomutase
LTLRESRVIDSAPVTNLRIPDRFSLATDLDPRTPISDASSMLSAVVFDFDGVLADSEPLHYEAYRRVLANRGIDLSREDYYARYLGFDDVGGFEAVLRDRGLDPTSEDIAELVEAKLVTFPIVLDGTNVIFPGAEACVRRCAAHVPVAIASGALRSDIDLVLGRAGLVDLFPVIVAAGETPRSKPFPDPYARAVAELQARGLVATDPAVASRCVAIEDSRWGIQSAKGAGLSCIGVTTAYEAAELADADLVVGNLEEVSIATLMALVSKK